VVGGVDLCGLLAGYVYYLFADRTVTGRV
jgi:hypothetical protein